VGEGQLTLPFSVPHGSRGRRLLILTRAEQVGALLVRGLLRWGLRLGLPVLSIAIITRSFPYTTSVAGVSLRVQATLLHRPGLSADTTLGNWEFPNVDGLPLGLHVSPQNVDVLALAQAADGDASAFANHLRDAAQQQIPHAVAWFAGEAVIGLLLGLAAAAMVNMAIGFLRGHARRPDELRHRARQLGAAALVAAAVAGYGAVSYNPHWTRQSRLTGTLAAAQLFPGQLSAYYQKSKASDVLGSVLGIQKSLQARIDLNSAPDTALQIMTISDMHLAANYPLVAQYAANYGVDLVINTGDESEFGTKAEMTKTYVRSIADLTKRTPMLWLAGNHDSPDVEKVMAAIPGVTVLGDKTADGDGYTVTAGEVDAFGLRIAGLPDPRVYGASGSYGADDQSVTDPLERQAVDGAVQGGIPQTQAVDIFATHEPVAAQQLRTDLPELIRQTLSGHVHAQNAAENIQTDQGIDLVEGSTGAGGLDNIVRGANAPPIEFSIESVAADCQFTRILRFQIRSPDADSGVAQTQQAYGDDVTVSTVYFRPQTVASGRSCGTSQGGVGPARSFLTSSGQG
jgi:predicted MPP superfamily phosphohydrolase